MKPINPAFTIARRRAQHDEARFGHPHLEYPAIVRRGKPVPDHIHEDLVPPERTAPKIPGWNSDTVILATCVLAFVSLFFI